MRASVLAAIAWRDLAMQLRGRRALVLPLIGAVLLVPLASVPFPRPPPPAPPGAIPLVGDVPEALRSSPNFDATAAAGVPIRERDGAFEVITDFVPPPLRDALNRALEPAAVAPVVPAPSKPLPIPGRTLLLALITASLLTGAVSESLPGERGRGTLESLLTAAVSRAEVVLGKWVAWAGIGAIVTLLAACVSIAAGLATAGPWMIALPLVAPAMVALGIFLVRHTSDLVGGATVSLRVLPAVLSTLGLAAWGIGLFDVHLGAAIPLGGALVVSGATWPGWTPALIATASTGGTTALLLLAAARDLDRPPARDGGPAVGRAALLVVATALVWFGTLLGPRIWAPAGNTALADALSPTTALLAATLALTILAAAPVASAQGWSAVRLDARPSGRWAWAIPAAALLVGAALLPGLTSPDDPLATRLSLAIWPAATSPWLALGAIASQELVFRGLLPRALPGVRAIWTEPLAAAVWIAVAMPHAPLAGLVTAVVLGALAWRTRSVVPGVLARFGAVLVLLAAGWV